MWRVFSQQTGIGKKHIIYVFSGGIAFLFLIPLITYIYFANDLKDKNSLVNSNNTGVVLLDRNNKPFYSFNHAKSITYIGITDITPNVQKAVIASEDKDFYNNPGFSVTGMLRALYIDVLSKQFNQGGSTITQQLVKNALLDSNKNFFRKYQEIVLAYELNRRYSKEDILEMYLNSVYFGEGAFGIENAAQVYFGVHSKDLDLAESSLLAGILPAPSLLSPISNGLDGAKKHQKIILQEMVQQGYISKNQAQLAENEVVTFVQKKIDTSITAPHFALYIKDLLIKQYGEENISRSGFIVKTTLNVDWQTYAEKIVQNQVARLHGDNVSNGSAVILDSKTSEIEAMVGSEDWENETFGKVNMTITPRQPGSSFKPIIYADALGQKLITPATILHDEPTAFPGNYSPHDFDYKYRGLVTVRRALANSLNIPAVEVMQKVGINEGVLFSRNLGIPLSDASNYGLSLVLGSAEVKLLDLTNVYATFANEGMKNQPTGILEITDKHNQSIYRYTPENKSIIDAGVAYLISSILSDSHARAEEFGNALTISQSAAVKTGTTEDFRDALTIGYTPNVTIGVWVGNNDNSPMDNIAGSLGAAPIWRQLMEHFLSLLPLESFVAPSSVTSSKICPYSSGSVTNATFSAYLEYFLSGTSLGDDCNITSSPTIEIPSAPVSAQGDSNIPTPTTAPSNVTSIPTNTAAPAEELSLTPTPSQFFIQPSPNPTFFIPLQKQINTPTQ